MSEGKNEGRQLNIAEKAKGPGYELKVGTDHDVTVAPKETAEDGKLRRKKDLILFSVGLGLFVAAVLVTVGVALMGPEPVAGAPMNGTGWARDIAKVLLGSVAGFVVAKKK